jgi:hypothetical protein
MSDDENYRECRCCRKRIPAGRLACPEHWRMLPAPIKSAITQTYRDRMWRAYVLNVTAADTFWQSKGIWSPPVPQSMRGGTEHE